jgi:hypothetical protein
MSIITVAAVQVPYFSPYRTPTLDTHSSGGEVKSGTGTKAHFELPLDFRSPTTSKNARWSPHQTPSERTAEEQQMSNNGTAPGLPLRDGSLNLPAASAPQNSPGYNSVTAQTSGNEVKMEKEPGHVYNFPPPSRRSPENFSEERKPSRSLGMQSILNPVHVDEEERPSRRRSAAQMEDEYRTESASVASISRPPSSSSVGTDEISPPGLHGSQGPRMMRRIITPISPRLRRTTSFSGIATGTISAVSTPFLPPSARMHTQEPGIGGIPPLPTGNPSHVQQRSPYGLHSAPTPPLAPLPAPRRSSVSMAHSNRASPSPSYSSYSQSGQASPTMSHHYTSGSGPTPPGSYRLAPSPVVGSLSNVPPVSLEGDQRQQQQQQQGYGIPVVSSGQNYQLLTIETGRGQTQLPVEVQAASRMADEKRKRNAGASARFRARRKEKEREASSRISNLEQELAFAIEDSEHYRRERDHLAEIITRTVPHYEGYFRDRPQSPRIGRVILRQVSECPSSMGDESPAPTTSVPISLERYEHLERIERLERLERERMEGERPATRRRTESFPVASPDPQSYASSPFPPYAPPQAGQQHPHQHQGPHFASPTRGGRPPSRQPSPRGPEAHEQYRMEQTYDRNWPRSGPPR